MQQIAQLLFSLQRAGNVKYLYFTVKFDFAKITVDELEKLVKIMTNDYELWQRLLGNYRKNYQYLNYFTSEQILFLRHELAKLSLDSELTINSPLDSELIALLQLVTPLPTTQAVQHAVKHAGQLIPTYRTDDDTHK